MDLEYIYRNLAILRKAFIEAYSEAYHPSIDPTGQAREFMPIEK